MNTDDLLEKQLAKLFSDAVLPEANGTLLRRRPVLASAVAISGELRGSIGIPLPIGKGSLVKPRWLTRPNLLMGSLATVPVVLALAALLAEHGNTGRPFTAVAQPAAQVEVVAPAKASEPATPFTTPFVAAKGSRVNHPATTFPTAPASSPVAVAANSADTNPKKSETSFTVAPYPTASAAVVQAVPSTSEASSTVEPTAALAPSPTVEPTATLAPSPIVEPTASPTPGPTIEPTVTVMPTPATTSAPDLSSLATPGPTSTAVASGPAQSSSIRLAIPSIGLDAPVVTVGAVHYTIDGQTATTWAVPEYFAAGWHHTSAPPGQAGNTVLNGHQNIYGGVFRNLIALEVNDEIIIHAEGKTYRYRVAERHLLQEEGQPLSVRAANARWIMPTGDERLTLITCAPDAQSTHRLIVVAFPAQPHAASGEP